MNHKTFNVTKGWHLINNVVTKLCSKQGCKTTEKTILWESTRDFVNSSNRGALLARESQCLREITRTCGWVARQPGQMPAVCERLGAILASNVRDSGTKQNERVGFCLCFRSQFLLGAATSARQSHFSRSSYTYASIVVKLTTARAHSEEKNRNVLQQTSLCMETY